MKRPGEAFGSGHDSRTRNDELISDQQMHTAFANRWYRPERVPHPRLRLQLIRLKSRP